MKTETFRVSGKIQRASLDCCRGRDSETGETYWMVTVYTYVSGIWEPLGTAVAFAPSRDAARDAACSIGLGGVPMLGQTEFSLDGVLRGKDYARRTTGYDD